MSEDGEIQVQIRDHAGNNYLVSLPPNTLVWQLVQAVVPKRDQPLDGAYYLFRKETGKMLAGNETLASAGIRDGETLSLVPDVVAGGGSSSMSTATCNSSP